MEIINAILVCQNPEVDFPSWICEDAAPQITEKEGQIVLCEECSDRFDRNPELHIVDEDTGKCVLALHCVQKGDEN